MAVPTLRMDADEIAAAHTLAAAYLPGAAACDRDRVLLFAEAAQYFAAGLGGMAWRLVPDGFSPWHLVYCWFSWFCDNGAWEAINHHLVTRDRERVGCEASLTAAVIDRQSAKTAGSGGVRDYDGGEKVEGSRP